jgi:hypothetical protein
MSVSRDALQLVILIAAHKNEEQLLRLIKVISHPQVTIYVHLDKKCRIKRGLLPAEVRVVENPVEVTWRLFSQVQAIINSMIQIVRDEPNFDYLTFISGQDYPIVPVKTMIDELAERSGAEFIHRVPLDQTGWNKARVRFERFYFHSYPNPLVRLLGGLVTWVSDKIRWKRRFHKGMRPWGGSAWWTLSRPCVQYILHFLDQDKALVKFMMKTVHPDEMLFHTIIMNSPFAGRAINENFRYLEWVKGNPNPNILTRNDFHKIVESHGHFARKFDPEIDEEILNMLDDYRNLIR